MGGGSERSRLPACRDLSEPLHVSITAATMSSQPLYYDKVSENEDDISLDQPTHKPSAVKRWSWGQQSFIIRTLVIAIYTILIAGICSAIVEYRHSDDSTTTAVAEATSTPAPAAQVEQAKAEVEAKPDTPNTGLDQIQHCGSNHTEAKALGCVYDVMMQLWMPAACYDEVLSERFLTRATGPGGPTPRMVSLCPMSRCARVNTPLPSC